MSGFVPRSYGAQSVRKAFGPNFLLRLAILVLILYEGGAATLPSDAEALIAIKAQVDPLTVRVGSCLESWNFTFDPCEPASPQAFVCGLRCSIQGTQYRVTSLTLSGSGYKGTLSEYIGNLSALQSADFSDNSFQGNIPASLGKLEKLTWLDLSSNILSESLPPSLGQLRSLQYISISSNQLSGPIPSSFSNLNNVTALYLGRNRFTGGLPAFDNLTQLVYLDASNNLLSGPLPRFPPQLVRVVLRGNSFNGQLLRSLKLLPQVTVIDLSSNNLTGIVGSFVFKLAALQQLNLSSNHFTALYVPRAVGSSALVSMDLSSNQLQGRLPPSLGSFESLSALTLSRNLLSGGIPDEYALKAGGSVQGVAPFSVLYLDGNYLDGLIPLAFLNMSQESLLSASFLNNCLQSCPPDQLFCQGGGQRSQAECDAFQARV